MNHEENSSVDQEDYAMDMGSRYSSRRSVTDPLS
jgi:hypothetical protein